MSKTTDEIIVKLLRRLDSEEQANECLHADLECVQLEVTNMKTEKRMFLMDIEKLNSKIAEQEKEINSLRSKHTETYLNEQVVHTLVMFLTNMGANMMTTEGVIKLLNNNGFLNYHAVVNKIYEEEQSND